MTKQVQRRRGTTAQHTGFTGAEGEISVNTTNKSIHVHDGATAGGIEAARADLDNVTTANVTSAIAGGTISSITLTTVDINGGTIDGATIGGGTAAAGTFTTLNATGGGALTGTWSNLGTVTTVDINGGTIDGVTIGGASAGAGTFTSITGTGLTVNGTADVDNLIIDNSGKISSVGQIEIQIDTDNNQTGTFIGFSRNNTTSERLALFQENGDISFYEDTGTTPKLFWDSSEERLGLGTVTPAFDLDVSSSSNVISKFSTSSSGFAPASILLEATGGASRGMGTYLYNTGGDDSWFSGVPYNVAGDKFVIAYESQAAFDNSVADVSHALMTVQSNGNVGIGTTSPTNYSGRSSLALAGSTNTGLLDFVNSGGSQGYIYADANGSFVIQAQKTSSESTQVRINSAGSSGIITLHTDNNAERMRIDSSGNLLLGKTSAGVNGEGFEATASGYIAAVRDGGPAAYFQRKTSDGEIVNFRKDNTTVGSIGSYASGSRLYLGSGDTGLSFEPANNIISPLNTSTAAKIDNAIDLGESGARFKDLYLSGSVYLGGTTSANALDDYEEGTWTPVYTTGSGAFGTITYDVQAGSYVKVGNVCVATFRMRTDSVDPGTATNLLIGGLPFTSGSTPAGSGMVDFATTFGGDTPSAIGVTPSATSAVIYYRSSANGATLAGDAADLGTGANANFFQGTIVYITA